MTASKNTLIRTTFTRAVADPKRFASHFKQRLFDRDPSLRRLFPAGEPSRDGSIVEILGFVVDGLRDKAALAAVAESIAARLQAAGVQPRHYGVMGQALLDTLAAQLGGDFTEEVHDAWADAYVQIAEAVMAARYNPFELVA